MLDVVLDGRQGAPPQDPAKYDGDQKCSPDRCCELLTQPSRGHAAHVAFAQLGQYRQYKATKAEVAFVQVDPAYTSQTCHVCGHVDKKNRRSQASFICGRCDVVGHAENNAALNIATRGAQRWGEVMRPDAAPTPAASQGGSSEPIGRPGTQGRAINPPPQRRVHDNLACEPARAAGMSWTPWH